MNTALSFLEPRQGSSRSPYTYYSLSAIGQAHFVLTSIRKSSGERLVSWRNSAEAGSRESAPAQENASFMEKGENRKSEGQSGSRRNRSAWPFARGVTF